MIAYPRTSSHGIRPYAFDPQRDSWHGVGYRLGMSPARIRSLRTRQGWTQAELAQRLGTDPVTVSRWERGTSAPRPSAIMQLARFEGTSSDVLALIDELGNEASARILRRHLLLSRAPRAVTFRVPPTQRLRDVEQQRRAQQRLKERMHVG